MPGAALLFQFFPENGSLSSRSYTGALDTILRIEAERTLRTDFTIARIKNS
jgi:hypothetical protein